MRIALSLFVAGSILAGVCTARAQLGPPAQTVPAPFLLTIRAVDEDVQAGSPLAVEVTVKNNSQRLEAYLTWGPIYYRKFDVRDSAGNRPLTARGRALLLGEGLSPSDFPRGSQSGQPIEPGKSITIKERVPSDIFDLTKPGAYTIQLLQPWGNEVMKSNTITVTVVPADAAHLAAAAAIPPRQPPIAVTITTVGGLSVFPGGHVALDVTTKNISDHFTNQRTARDKRDLQRFYRVDVQDSQGGTPPETDLGRQAGNRGDVPPRFLGPNAVHGREDVRGGSYMPGDERRVVITVSDLYDLSKPGQYTLQVRRWDDETKTWVKSNQLTVTVTQ
ncbi:MAG: hypothetical protein P4N24_02635 [Acidobacteriota bacterium]|nr:hypothetical protein [Acidobacteriota bacterium]